MPSQEWKRKCLPKGWANVKEAATYAGVQPRTVRTWLKEGLAYSRLSRKLILIRFDAIDEFLERFEINEAHQERELKGIVDDVFRTLK
jgi:excisionase family DNA binding protein